MTVTPIVPLIRRGTILKAVKAVLLGRVAADVYVHAVDLDNRTMTAKFGNSGEVVFGGFTPVGVWLSFDQFATECVPEVKIVLVGDTITI